MTNMQLEGLRNIFINCGQITGPIKEGRFDQCEYVFVTNGLREFRINLYGEIEEKEWRKW